MHLFGMLRLSIFGILENLKVSLPTSFTKILFFITYLAVAWIKYSKWIIIAMFIWYATFICFLEISHCYVYLADKSSEIILNNPSLVGFSTYRWFLLQIWLWWKILGDQAQILYLSLCKWKVSLFSDQYHQLFARVLQTQRWAFTTRIGYSSKWYQDSRRSNS